MAISTDTDTDTESGNAVDRAAESAERALEATRRATGAAIDRVAEKVHDVRDVASPALDRLTSPFDTLVTRTQRAPLQMLLLAAAAGAAAMGIAALLRSVPARRAV